MEVIGGGGSLDLSGAVCAVSSIISVYPGCNTNTNFSEIIHTNPPFHYGGFSI